MANQIGFEFEIRGTVFVPRASALGTDIVAAFNEAVELRHKIQGALLDVPAEFTITEPKARSRRVVETQTESVDMETPPDQAGDDGPTPALDLPTRHATRK